MTWTALPITSGGAFLAFGPRGISGKLGKRMMARAVARGGRGGKESPFAAQRPLLGRTIRKGGRVVEGNGLEIRSRPMWCVCLCAE
jgi:hypothetical protein